MSSVTEQNYIEKEYIIVDGASTDGTLEVIEQFAQQFHYIRYISEPDKGLYYAMNRGIGISTGEVVGILNAGDFYTSNEALTKVIDAFRKHPTDTLYADLQYVSNINKSKIVRHWESGRFSVRKMFFGWMPPHPTFFVKKHIYERFGYFDTELEISADYELMLRLLYKFRVSTQYLPGVLVKMPIGGASNSSLSNRIQANIEDRRAWSKNNLSPRFYTLTWKPLSKIRQFFHRKK